jgi:hypothetical protein
MAGVIEVRVGGRGIVRGDESTVDAQVRSRCSLCSAEAETVASISAPGGTEMYACPNCLRERLDAISVGRWRLRDGQSAGLPWGKLSG